MGVQHNCHEIPGQYGQRYSSDFRYHVLDPVRDRNLVPETRGVRGRGSTGSTRTASSSLALGGKRKAVPVAVCVCGGGGRAG